MSPPPDSVIELRGVRKQYGGRIVLQDVDLVVHQGDVIGLIGPNGSGKSTLLRIMAGLVRPTGGDVLVAQQNISAELGVVPRGLGLLFEPPGFQPHLTGLENLRLLASIRRMIELGEIRAWMLAVGLDPNSRQRVVAYSQGMKQRLGLAQALMERPDILLLDEPSNGLDPEFRDTFGQLLRDAQTRGVAIVMASHHLEELGPLCNRIVRVSHGHLTPVAPAALKSEEVTQR